MTDIKKNEDQVLDYTQEIRERIVNKLTSSGISGDVKELHVLLATLDGMDRAALTKKKIIAENEITDKNAVAGAAIIELLSNLRKDGRPQELSEVTSDQTQIPDNLPTPEIIPGELEGSDPTVSFDNLMKEEQ